MNITVKKSALALFLASLLALPLSALAATGNVKGVDAVEKSSSEIDLSWISLDDAVNYRVYYNSIADGGSVQNGETFAYVNQVDTDDNYTVDDADPKMAHYTLSDLDPNTTYYMAVTASDSENVESDSYSLEVNATTLDGQAQPEEPEEDVPAEENNEEESDTTAPTVVKVMAEDSTHVVVGFSEKVMIPATNPETAFTIKEQINASNVLDVISAQVHPNDASGKTIQLQTAEQTNNITYILTVGIQVKDEAGNAMNSGVADSGPFLGTNEGEENTEQETNNETTLLNCGTHYEDDASKNTDGAQACFEVSFGTCSPSTYTIVSEKNGQKMNYEYEVKQSESNGCSIETQYSRNDANPSWENKTMNCTYDNGKSFSPAEKEVLDSLGKAVELGNCSGPLYDLMAADNQTEETPQETSDPVEADDQTNDTASDVSDLKLSFQQMANSALYMVNLTWAGSDAANLFDQVLYQSKDGGNSYNSGASLGKIVESHTVNDLEGGEEYTFKLTTKDAAGEETDGMTTSITLPDVLPESGAGMGLVLLGSGVIAHRVLRRRRRK